jgi:hypothetical protein
VEVKPNTFEKIDELNLPRELKAKIGACIGQGLDVGALVGEEHQQGR